MYDAIMLYLIDMLVLEPNVLRDSILVSGMLYPCKRTLLL